MATTYPILFPGGEDTGVRVTTTGDRRVTTSGDIRVTAGGLSVAIKPESFSINYQSAIGQTESIYSYSQQTTDNTGRRWVIDVRMPRMERSLATPFISFISKLEGRKGTFTMYIPGSEEPQGNVSGDVQVDGGSQTGTSINLKGFAANTINAFIAGDYIQIGSGATTRLHQVVNNASSDSSGQLTAEIRPAIRTSPADNATVKTSNVRGLFRLTANNSGHGVSSPNFYDISFSAVEAI